MKSLLVILTLTFAAFGVTGCEGPPAKTTDASLTSVKSGVSELSPAEARPATEAAYSQFIDVRTPEEYSAGHAYRAVNIPLDTLKDNLDRLEKNEPVYVICETGRRSKEAAEILNAAGFTSVISITGGTAAWRDAGLPMANGASATVGGTPVDTTKQALIDALNDERRSRALYQAMSDKFDGARPFVNIVEAEKRHEERLLPLFKKYGVAIPANTFDPAKMETPSTRAEACRVGVDSEKKNIAMYDGFFKFVKEQDVIEAFRYLQEASRQNHLPAFTRCSEGGGMGQGRVRRGGGPPFNN